MYPLLAAKPAYATQLAWVGVQPSASRRSSPVRVTLNAAPVTVSVMDSSAVLSTPSYAMLTANARPDDKFSPGAYSRSPQIALFPVTKPTVF